VVAVSSIFFFFTSQFIFARTRRRHRPDESYLIPLKKGESFSSSTVEGHATSGNTNSTATTALDAHPSRRGSSPTVLSLEDLLDIAVQVTRVLSRSDKAMRMDC
jgi:hypothetical protein